MAKTGRLLFGASENSADMLYLTGFSAPDPFLWLEIGERHIVIVNSMEQERARKQCKPGTEVYTPAQAARIWNLGKAKCSYSNLVAAIARQEKCWNWVVNNDIPYFFVDKLWNTRLAAGSHNGTTTGEKICIIPNDQFTPERECKSPAEIEHVRQSERIAEAGLNRGLQLIREAKVDAKGFLIWDGKTLTAEMLQGEVNAEIARNNGSATGTITAPGVQGADPHLTGSGPVHVNAPIVFDIFPRSDATGYFGDLTRTVVKGKAPEIVKKAFTAVYDAQRTAIEMLKPGIAAKDVHNKASEVMASHGFKTDLRAAKPYGFIHSLGHGVGLEIHEAPSLSAKSTIFLQPGHIVTVEPGLYYPEWGGIRIEDTLAITEEGFDDLAVAEVFLEIE